MERCISYFIRRFPKDAKIQHVQKENCQKHPESIHVNAAKREKQNILNLQHLKIIKLLIIVTLSTRIILLELF